MAGAQMPARPPTPPNPGDKDYTRAKGKPEKSIPSPRTTTKKGGPYKGDPKR